MAGALTAVVLANKGAGHELPNRGNAEIANLEGHAPLPTFPADTEPRVNILGNDEFSTKLIREQIDAIETALDKNLGFTANWYVDGLVRLHDGRVINHPMFIPKQNSNTDVTRAGGNYYLFVNQVNTEKGVKNHLVVIDGADEVVEVSDAGRGNPSGSLDVVKVTPNWDGRTDGTPLYVEHEQLGKTPVSEVSTADIPR